MLREITEKGDEMGYMFSAEDLLNCNVCKWCARKNCPTRNKIVNLSHCENLEFDKTKTDRHDAWNATRQKICLAHALCCDPPHMFDDERFREWVKQSYQGKNIHI